jgi:hypothetical protein
MFNSLRHLVHPHDAPVPRSFRAWVKVDGLHAAVVAEGKKEPAVANRHDERGLAPCPGTIEACLDHAD